MGTFVPIVFCILVAICVTNAAGPITTPVRVGFFSSGPIQDGGYISAIYDGILRIKNKYSNVQLGFHGVSEVRTCFLPPFPFM